MPTTKPGPKRPAREPADPLKEKIRPRRERPTPPTLLRSGLDPDRLAEVGEREFSEWRESAKLDVITQALQKLPLLMQRYEIAPGGSGKYGKDEWLKLALFLAMDHEPGFQVEFKPERVGRPQAWDGLSLGRLFIDVWTLQNQRAQTRYPLSVAAACLNLSKSHEAWRGFTAKVLENRYHEAAKGPIAELLLTIDADQRVPRDLLPGLLPGLVSALQAGKK